VKDVGKRQGFSRVEEVKGISVAGRILQATVTAVDLLTDWQLCHIPALILEIFLSLGESKTK
jgi:hypothetical protein